MCAKSTRGGWWLVVAIMALLATTAGCDPTLKSTVEDGVISVSTSFLGAVLRAWINLVEESQTTTTAMLVHNVAPDIFA